MCPRLLIQFKETPLAVLTAAVRSVVARPACRAHERVLAGGVLKQIRESGRYQEDPAGTASPAPASTHRRKGEKGTGKRRRLTPEEQRYFAWVEVHCGLGQVQAERYLSIADLALELIWGRDLTLTGLEIVQIAHADLRPLVIELAEKRTDRQLPPLRTGVRSANAMLRQDRGQVEKARERVRQAASGEWCPPGRKGSGTGKGDRPASPAPPPAQAEDHLAGLAGAVQQLVAEKEAGKAVPAERAAQLLARLREVGHALALLCGEEPRRQPRNEPGGSSSTQVEEEQNRNENNGLDAGEGGDEEEAPEDWHVPIAVAIRAALDEAAQQEVGWRLYDMARGVDMAVHEGPLRALWERCHLEEAGIDREHFGFLMDHISGPDMEMRVRFVLQFLKASQLADHDWLIYNMRVWDVPDPIWDEIWAVGDQVPLFGLVPGEGPDAELEVEFEVTRRMIERLLPEIPKMSPEIQREILKAAMELYAILTEWLGPEPPPPPSAYGLRPFPGV
jgi:hypothetical protein